MTHTPQSRPILRHKYFSLAGLAIAGFFQIAASAQAQESATADGHKVICLPAQNIENTEALNDHQMLFHMRGHKVFVNNLSTPCASLKDINYEGFVWVAHGIPEYCDNLEQIRIRSTGEMCMLGAFAPYEAPTVAK
jgi:hypothetical protein